MKKETKKQSDDTPSVPETPPGANFSSELISSDTIRITVGIKNSFQVGNRPGEWANIGPFISGSVDVPADSNLFQEGHKLYTKLLPFYGFLMVNEALRAQNVIKKGAVEVGKELLALMHPKITEEGGDDE